MEVTLQLLQKMTAKFSLTQQQEEQAANVVAAYDALRRARNEFLACLKADSTLPAWTLGEDGNSSEKAREAAAQVYGQFFFPVPQSADVETNDDADDEDDEEKSVVAKEYGVIGASASTIEKAVKLNKVKKIFNEALIPLRVQTLTYDQGEGLPKGEIQMDRAVLAQNGLAYLSEQQACRQIVITERLPKNIRFLWSRGFSVYQISVKRLRSALADMRQSPQVNAAREQLLDMPWDEPLAVVRPLKPHIRANIGIPTPAEHVLPKLAREDVDIRVSSATPKRTRKHKATLIRYKQVRTAMPILVPYSPGQDFPERKELEDPREEEGESLGQKRKLDEKPFLDLGSYEIYRYTTEKNVRESIRTSEEWRKKLDTEKSGPLIGSRNRGLLST